MYIFGKNNNHLIKNNYKATFSLPQKIRLIQKQIIKCACGNDFIICLTKDQNVYCYFQSAVYNVEFKKGERIIDIDTQQNLILFVTQKGELYATQIMAEKLMNDTLKPKLIRLNFSFSSSKSKVIKQVKMVNEQIFLKMENNLVFYLKRNDWMETKTFSDPEFVVASKNNNIKNIASFKGSNYFLTTEGNIISASRNQLSLKSRRIQSKQKFEKIVSNEHQILGINEQGFIVKIYIDNDKAKTQKVWKISTRFQDLVIGNQNYYGITDNRQAWVWGKNANGQLGLSDYEPRTSLYPLVSLQKYFIKNFFTGQNYVCCLVDDTKLRDELKGTQRQSIKSPTRQIRFTQIQKNNQQCHDSFNQTDQFLMPIRYTEDESKSSYTEHNESCSQTNVIINKMHKNQKENVFRKRQQHRIKPTERQHSKSSIRMRKDASKISDKKISQNSCSRSKGKSVLSHSKLTPKSVNRQKSLFKSQKPNLNNHYLSSVSDVTKSLIKSQKKQVIDSYKTSNAQSSLKESNYKKKIDFQYRSRFQKQFTERQLKQKQLIILINQTNKIEKQRLEEKICSLQFHLKNKTEENKDLFQLISQKNRIIEDITSKICLLEEAIEQHEKTLTSRDNEAEEFFLKEKEYQLHIQKLQSQVQKMMEVLNYNERTKETEIYKKQMERLSSEIKFRIDEQKQYYRERIKSVQRNFDQERNLYQIQIRNLQQEITSYKQKQLQSVAKLNQQLNRVSMQIQTACVDNNSSNYMESPTFHTLDVKNNLKRHVEDNYDLNQSQITLNDRVNEYERIPFKQSNRQEPNQSSLQKSHNDIKTRKNSRTDNLHGQRNNEDQENYPIQKSQSQVKEILDKIEVSKTYISKSANKLFNLLQSDRA